MKSSYSVFIVTDICFSFNWQNNFLFKISSDYGNLPFSAKVNETKYIVFSQTDEIHKTDRDVNS